MSYQVQPSTLRFLWADTPAAEADIIIVGFPFDGTTSYRAGTRFGPNALREGSWTLEVYSPHLDRSLTGMKIADVGDLPLPPTGSERVTQMIYEYCSTQMNAGKKLAGIGGEHSVSYGLIKACFDKYPDLQVFHFDAHADLREDWMGERWSHASIIKRVLDFLPPNRLTQYGIRSGTQDEFTWMRANNTLVENRDELIHRMKNANAPIFITFDLDFYDPAYFPGTGTPEPGGGSPHEIFSIFNEIKNDINLVGFDALELAPQFDSSNVSGVLAAKTLRELLLLF
ncbi:MAG: agmatinase [Candidatus Marinimicrobia bacterium CG_4_9_14_3_um_filter_48_9]|nr:MAG: agmatinase [Candidatus Marinimicrobia bacterium CG_4_9_14_3_um_filter_48_9]